MKKVIPLLLAALLLAGCASAPAATVETTAPVQTTAATEAAAETAPVAVAEAPVYTSRFDSETVITLSDDGLTVNGGGETDTVYTSHDIVYYEEKTAYESGNPYGAGSETDMHTAEEAQAHTVVNITAPGAYRLSGKLSAGQIRIDLGEDAASDPDAVVELILDGADITCTVAPAILFRNVYECDGGWNTETAQPTVDTTDAGANLILAENSRSTVSGSYVAKIYKDAEGEKKLWKQDGAVYSYMSMNVYGPGALDITAENEGLNSELHLTINGGDIAIRSQDDGINTNEDGVSVTTVNGGKNIVTLMESVFLNDVKLSRIELPNVVTIKGAAFRQTAVNFKFPKSLRVIELQGFMECSGLTDVVLPDTMDQLGTTAFASCPNLTSIKFPKVVNDKMAAATGILQNNPKLTIILVPAKALASNPSGQPKAHAPT